MMELSAASDRAGHVPVLYDEVLAWLQPSHGRNFIDATLGAGGHANGLLERSGPDGRLLGFDADPGALAIARQRLSHFGDRAVVVQSNFSHIGDVAREQAFESVAGILLDLGLSSLLLQTSGRGFSFMRDEPLDMRLDPRQTATAADLINGLPERELARILKEFGEEPNARKIARAIAAFRSQRPILTSRELATIVSGIVRRRDHLHPATQTFQALRIAANSELDRLAETLPQTLALLAPGGRLAVISYHSLEDRLVKRFMISEQRGCVCPPKLPVCVCGRKPTLHVLTTKPVAPTAEEIERNPRSRSAKMRVAERLPTTETTTR